MKQLLFLLLTCTLVHSHTTTDLKVGHQRAPLGVDDPAPRLSWCMDGKEKGLRQTSYQILVASSAKLLSEEGQFIAPPPHLQQKIIYSIPYESVQRYYSYISHLNPLQTIPD